MNSDEVPQDKDDFKGRSLVKKVVYATDNGDYTKVQSQGWDIEIQATKQAWEDIEFELANIKQQVLQGKLSPVAYYMHLKLMDIGMLASYMGKWKWTVKKHLTPKGFASLSEGMLQKYADVFQISIHDLKNV